MTTYSIELRFSAEGDAFSTDKFDTFEEASEQFELWKKCRNFVKPALVLLLMNEKVLSLHYLHATYWACKHLDGDYWISKKELNKIVKNFNVSNFIKTHELDVDYFRDHEGTIYYHKISVLKAHAAIEERKHKKSISISQTR